MTTKSNTKLIATWCTDEEQTLMPAHKHTSDILNLSPTLGIALTRASVNAPKRGKIKTTSNNSRDCRKGCHRLNTAQRRKKLREAKMLVAVLTRLCSEKQVLCNFLQHSFRGLASCSWMSFWSRVSLWSPKSWKSWQMIDLFAVSRRLIWITKSTICMKQEKRVFGCTQNVRLHDKTGWMPTGTCSPMATLRITPIPNGVISSFFKKYSSRTHTTSFVQQ